MATKLTTADFIQKAHAVHGVGKYDYSDSVYMGFEQKIAICCPLHGVFMQQAGSHMRGVKCPDCAKSKRGGLRRNSLTQFLEKARAHHGTKYDYSQVVYVGNKQAVTIICPTHGPFNQTAAAHTNAGKGCVKCRTDKLKGLALLRSAKSKLQFAAKATELHKNRYDYSKSVYVRNDIKVVIICPVHGEFEQMPSDHLSGCGCWMCRNDANAQRLARLPTWIEQAGEKPGTLYLLRFFDDKEAFYKDGVTSNSVRWRYRQTAARGGYSYEILAQHTSANAAAVYDWEQSILETFAYLRYTPKRPFGGASECFSEAEPILAIFPL